jgi:hypothetical protein
MVDVLRRIRIFVASPSDVGDERNRLDGLIRELNRILNDRMGLFLELVRWETHGRPGFGDDAQDVLNKQLPPTDIFLGIMWTRFGTPTKRAESGTEEEFDRAHRMWQMSGRPRLLFYFKQAPFYPTGLSDLEQFQKVLRFREALSQRGGLYWTFNSADEFIGLVREHLLNELSAMSNPMDDNLQAPPREGSTKRTCIECKLTSRVLWYFTEPMRDVLRLEVSLLNTDDAPVTITRVRCSVTPFNGDELECTEWESFMGVKPPLPIELVPGARSEENFYFAAIGEPPSGKPANRTRELVQVGARWKFSFQDGRGFYYELYEDIKSGSNGGKTGECFELDFEHVSSMLSELSTRQGGSGSTTA